MKDNDNRSTTKQKDANTLHDSGVFMRVCEKERFCGEAVERVWQSDPINVWVARGVVFESHHHNEGRRRLAKISVEYLLMAPS